MQKSRISASESSLEAIGRLTAWDVLVFVATIFVAGHAPLYAVFDDPPSWALTLDGWATLLFIGDIVLRFRRPIRVGGRPVSAAREIARRYLTGWFTVDLLAAIPFGLIGLAVEANGAGRTLALLGLTRALRLARIASLQREWRTRSMLSPALFRLAFFGAWAALLTHWIACGWVALGATAASASSLPRYLQALYWTITTLTTVGYGDITPTGTGQTMYAMAAMVLGVAMYGYVIGNVANLLANADVFRAEHLARVETVGRFLSNRGMPRDFQRRVRDYYDYLWASQMGHPEKLFDDLPTSLQVEMALHLNRPILAKVPLFRGAGEPVLRELVRHLRPAVFTPGDAILQRGDPGRRIFFIHRGSVEVLGTDDASVIATLSDGDFFGEMALLDNRPRTATVRAVDYCDLYTLDRDRFEEVLALFPEFADEIRRTARERRAPAS